MYYILSKACGLLVDALIWVAQAIPIRNTIDYRVADAVLRLAERVNHGQRLINAAWRRSLR